MVLATIVVALAALAGDQGSVRGEQSEQVIPVWWSPNLGLKNQADVDRALSAPFDDDNDFDVELQDKTKRHFHACRDILAVPPAAIRKLEYAGTTGWGILWAAVADCNAINLIKSAKPARRSYVTAFTFSPKHIAKLPPLLAEIDECGSSCPENTRSLAKAIKTCMPWRRYDSRLKVKIRHPNEADVSTDGWTGELTLYARGDFNDDGIEDLLMLRYGQAEGGTLTDATVFVLTKTSTNSCMEVVRALTFGHYP
jgi:hypothetical protein